ncbi:hypothetical protein KKJ09_18425 [Xenorhabdus bovienii]|uniref:hypothetical protein n=1 Tax=Xenorhabdus bovienii TaxID=40576 RepID=UPI0023B2E0F2|nr:hypothetical protein [Xenorhabdus bovienii]MDE9495506.1 hypothetical protein [Xenorhabdus bovienii]MDE9503930.1 hypothetical protein [Xenorhabdus bovienii]MDE9526734.1 hypothetical protein [Xenorhabdus bovienii]MDE9570362.1 hypothetical protein [Xenorhabdus bovienii]
MSDIYNHLVRTNFNDMSTEELKDLRVNSEAAFNSVMAAMSAIGEMALRSMGNNNYSGEQAKGDVCRLSEALMHLPRIAEALNDTEQSARFELHHREGFPKW